MDITIVTLCLLLLTILPQSYSQPHHNIYTVCSRPFNCGPKVSKISYPFWGDQQRPDYCGGGKDFSLHCDDNQHTSIQIGSQSYGVLKINNSAYTMRIIRTDTSTTDVCDPQFRYNSFDDTPFGYPKGTHNITIFYGCPPRASFGGNTHKCPNENSIAFFEDVNDTLYDTYPGLKECIGPRIHVPASHSLDPDGGIGALISVLGYGFTVNYSVTHAQECKTCWESKGACGTDDTSNYQFSCHCPDGSDASDCSAPIPNPNPNESRNTYSWERKAIIGVASATMGGLLIGFAICYFRCKPTKWQKFFWLTTKSNQDIEEFLKDHGGLALKRYKFTDVKKMTNSFKVKLGQGGFGVVYQGMLLTGCPVAVKILNESKTNGEEFINEVASISKTSHINVVTLLGFCLEGRKKALIYEFVANGSLENFIYKKGPQTTSSLSWDNLHQIAVGIARGLEYLHKGCNTRILHFDIKPHNILLDENLCPKISDFGLAKLCPRKESVISLSDARGTMGYVAPEVWNRHFGGVSHKSDVYSYGMMLLEMVGGRKNIDADASHTSEIYFPHWVYRRLELGANLGLDGVVATEENEITKRMTVVGLWCIQTFPHDRPAMSKVVDMLEGSMNSLEMPPKPILSSTTRSVVESSTTLN